MRCGRGGGRTFNVDAGDIGGKDGFGVVAPVEDGALGFGVLAEDEAEEDVETAEGEEEEGGDEGEVIDEMRKDRGAESEDGHDTPGSAM